MAQLWRFLRLQATGAQIRASDRIADASAQNVVSASRGTTRDVLPEGVSTNTVTKFKSNLMQRLMLFTGCFLLATLFCGCTAFRPLKGIPVQALPWDMRGVSRANMETIDLSRLTQSQPPVHLVDSGDVLAVYVEGILGKVDDVPPVYLPQNAVEGRPTLGFPIPVREDGSISLPLIPPLNVRGLTIAQVEDLVHRTYTQEKQQLEHDRARILVSLQKPRSYKVTVLRQESSNSLITSQSGNGAIQLGQLKKGTGQIVTLPIGENDVLRALTLSGGLPGLDAQNAIYILRKPRVAPQPWAYGTTTPVSLRSNANLKSRSKTPIQLTSDLDPYTPKHTAPALLQSRADTAWGHSVPHTDEGQLVDLEPAHGSNGWGDHSISLTQGQDQGQEYLPQGRYSPPMTASPQFAAPQFGTRPGPVGIQPQYMPLPTNGPYVPPELQPYMGGGTRILRIPIRLRPGEVANFGEQDIILYDGDILFIESRETEIFYTGGLLGGGQHMLPRDYDLEVLDAISIAQGGLQGGNGQGFGSHIGGITALNQDITVSASDLVVIRRMPDGTRMNIKVDLNKALRDQNENLLIQPGDHLILRYTPIEAMGAFIERNFLAGSLFGLTAQQALNNK